MRSAARPSIAARAARSLVAAAFACALSGCLHTMIQDAGIGDRAERIRYEHAVRSGDRLFLFYCLQRGGPCDARWSAIDLTQVAWEPLEISRPKPDRADIRLTVEVGPRPPLAAEESVDLPIRAITPTPGPFWHPGGPAVTLRAMSEGRALGVYRVSPMWVFVVARDHDGGGDGRFVRIADPIRVYRTWWGTPTRAVLYTLAMPIDVAASPIELAMLWMFARGLSE